MYAHALLTDAFIMRKMLEKQSVSLYKQAHPFSYHAMQDWVNALSNKAQPSAAELSSSATKSVTMTTVASHRQLQPRHLWQMDPDGLTLGPVIGTGGHGQVFRGTYKGSTVAIKTLVLLEAADSAAASNILKETAAEAEALSRLRHENVMRFYGICFLQEQNIVAMVTELCKLDLRSWIDRPGQWACPAHLPHNLRWGM